MSLYWSKHGLIKLMLIWNSIILYQLMDALICNIFPWTVSSILLHFFLSHTDSVLTWGTSFSILLMQFWNPQHISCVLCISHLSLTANQNSLSLKQDLQENSIESHEEVFTHSIVSLFFGYLSHLNVSARQCNWEKL